MGLALLFPGQGAQHVGMGQALYDQFPSVHSLYEQASTVIGCDLAKLCFDGPENDLNATDKAQVALLVNSLAMAQVLEEDNLISRDQISAAAGLSLGEISALVWSQALSFQDGVSLVAARGRYMQSACDAKASTMVSLLRATVEQAEELCQQARGEDVLVVANLNCPGQVVISGDVTACERATELAGSQKIKAIPLTVAGAFHSPLMKPADEQLAALMVGFAMQAPAVPVASNVTGQLETDPEKIRQLLPEQVVSAVRFEDDIRALIQSGVTSFVEVGAGQVISGLLRKIDRSLSCVSINSPEDFGKLEDLKQQGKEQGV